MHKIRRGLVTAGFLAAMFGGGAVGAVAFGATGSGAATTTTTTPGITIAPSSGGTTTTTTPSQAPGQGGRDCPDHGTQGSAAGSTASF